MVFAAWAGKREHLTADVAQAFADSCQWGRNHIDEIVERAMRERGYSAELVRKYLTEHIVYELGPRHREGLELFRKLARAVPAPAPEESEAGVL